jgi:hypothetical protein
MDEDWQDRLYDVGVPEPIDIVVPPIADIDENGDDVDGEGGGGGGGGNSSESSVGGGGDDDEYKAGYKDLQNVTFGRAGTDVNKVRRNAIEEVIDKAWGILGSTSFNFIDKSTQQSLVDIVERMQNPQLYNLRILLFALSWQVRKIKLTPINFKTFVDKYLHDPVDQVDLLRYLRMLKIV